MTAHPTDDELRAMLEARAGAVSPGTAREALAGARAAIAGPMAERGAGVAFDPRPVATVRRRSRTPWGIAAVAAAAVVAVALLGSRVQPDRPAASAPAVIAGASQGPAGSDRAVLVRDITVDELRSQLRAGELDGKTVVIPGRLYQEYGRCRAVADCTWLRVDGISNVVIDRGGRSVDEVQSEIDRFGTSAPLVLRGVDRDLELVGWLTVGASEPTQVWNLGPHDGSLSGGSLALVDGWVIGALGKSCPINRPCGTGNAWLTAVEPLSDGTPDQRQPMSVAHVDPEIGLLDASHGLAGPFLVRESEAPEDLGALFEVVARLSPSTTVWVQQPRTQLAGPTIPAADLMAALRDGSLDGQVFAIDGELKSVAWDCPLDARPCQRFYVDGLPGVAVTWSGALQGSDGSPGAPVSAMQGRLLVTPRNGYLQLLGRLDGALDRPDLLDELPSIDLPPFPDPLALRAVDGWLVVDGVIYCALIRPGAATPCPPARSLLTPSEPRPSGELTSPQNVLVEVHRGAPGIGVLPIRQAGPFLIRYDVVGSVCDAVPNADASCAGEPRSGWIVEAAYDPASVRVVTFP
jgi:hypothetical protein